MPKNLRASSFLIFHAIVFAILAATKLHHQDIARIPTLPWQNVWGVSRIWPGQALTCTDSNSGFPRGVQDFFLDHSIFSTMEPEERGHTGQPYWGGRIQCWNEQGEPFQKPIESIKPAVLKDTYLVLEVGHVFNISITVFNIKKCRKVFVIEELVTTAEWLYVPCTE